MAGYSFERSHHHEDPWQHHICSDVSCSLLHLMNDTSAMQRGVLPKTSTSSYPHYDSKPITSGQHLVMLTFTLYCLENDSAMIGISAVEITVSEASVSNTAIA